MFLVLKRRIVSHGDDDWYKFETSDPIGVVNTKEDAEKYVAAVDTKYRAAMDAWREGLYALLWVWKDTHPKPDKKPFVAVPKWGVVKNADITPEMRAERESIKQQNQEIERENNKTFSVWYDEFAEYLAQYKPPKKQHLEIQEIALLIEPR